MDRSRTTSLSEVLVGQIVQATVMPPIEHAVARSYGTTPRRFECSNYIIAVTTGPNGTGRPTREERSASFSQASIRASFRRPAPDHDDLRTPCALSRQHVALKELLATSVAPRREESSCDIWPYPPEVSRYHAGGVAEVPPPRGVSIMPPASDPMSLANKAAWPKDGLRITFGVVWLVDAILKWLPGFRIDYMSTIMG